MLDGALEGATVCLVLVLSVALKRAAIRLVGCSHTTTENPIKVKTTPSIKKILNIILYKQGGRYHA
jgi:hypothetical protein